MQLRKVKHDSKNWERTFVNTQLCGCGMPAAVEPEPKGEEGQFSLDAFFAKQTKNDGMLPAAVGSIEHELYVRLSRRVAPSPFA